jgi:hypothetical protein
VKSLVDKLLLLCIWVVVLAVAAVAILGFSPEQVGHEFGVIWQAVLHAVNSFRQAVTKE